MDPGHRLETLHENGDVYGDNVTSWVSVCPRGLWTVQRTLTHEESPQTVSRFGDDALASYSPRLGSLCRVRVRLGTGVDEAESLEPGEDDVQPDQAITEATALPRCPDSVLQVPLGDWTTLRLGEGHCDVTEACVEGMRAGQKCEILISPAGNGPDVSAGHPVEDDMPIRATVELHAFTPGQESWEVSLGEKWEWVRSHKDRGGVRFRSGDVWGAADSYSRALKPLIALYGSVREATKNEQRDTNTVDESRDETQQLPSVDELRTTKAELHSNMSLCQLKLNRPELAKASAAKATQLDPGGAKAWYRLGQACELVNELEEAKHAFRKLLELQPESTAALKALKNIANKEKETNVQLGIRLSKMFS